MTGIASKVGDFNSRNEIIGNQVVLSFKSLLKGAKGTGSFARKGLDLKSNGRV